LRKKHRLKEFENRVLREVLGLRGTKEQGNGEEYIMRSFMSCIVLPVLFS